jgi:RimJ/RimL family protein N-acetyltransferase
VGIVLLHDYHHQGIGTKALQLLSAYATERLHLRSLYAYVALDNAPAQALFRQLGYSEVGCLQGWIEGNQTATLFQLML